MSADLSASICDLYINDNIIINKEETIEETFEETKEEIIEETKEETKKETKEQTKIDSNLITNQLNTLYDAIVCFCDEPILDSLPDENNKDYYKRVISCENPKLNFIMRRIIDISNSITQKSYDHINLLITKQNALRLIVDVNQLFYRLGIHVSFDMNLNNKVRTTYNDNTTPEINDLCKLIELYVIVSGVLPCHLQFTHIDINMKRDMRRLLQTILYTILGIASYSDVFYATDNQLYINSMIQKQKDKGVITFKNNKDNTNSQFKPNMNKGKTHKYTKINKNVKK